MTLDVGCSMFDVRCSMLDVECWMLDVGSSVSGSFTFRAANSAFGLQRCHASTLQHLKHSIREVMTPLDPAARIRAQVILRPYPEPRPLFTRLRIFARQSFRQSYSRQIRSAVGVVKTPDSRQVLSHRFDHRVRQRHKPVLVALSSPDGDDLL